MFSFDPREQSGCLFHPFKAHITMLLQPGCKHQSGRVPLPMMRSAMMTSTITTAASSQAPLRCSLFDTKATATSKPMPINVYIAAMLHYAGADMIVDISGSASSIIRVRRISEIRAAAPFFRVISEVRRGPKSVRPPQQTDIVGHGRHVQKVPIALVKVCCHGQRISVRWIATPRRSSSIRKVPEADILASKIDSPVRTTNVDESAPFLCPRRK